jgi:hypothetical protein
VFRNGGVALLGKSASGVKLTNPLKLPGGGSVRRTYVHDNIGNGIWTNCGATGDTLRANTVVRNSQKGIFVEISAGPIYVVRNVVKSNNTANLAKTGGIVVVSSRHVRVLNNTLADNLGTSILVYKDARAGNSDPRPCKHGFFLRDVVVSGNYLGGGTISGCSLAGVFCTDNTP